MKTKTISQKELGERINRTTRQIRKLTEEHGMPRNEDGTYPWPEALEWWVRFKQEEKERRTGTEDSKVSELDRARTSKEWALAQLREIELAEKEGRLIPLEVHEQRLLSICERLAARVKGLGRYMGDVQRATTDMEAAELLDRISDDLLRSLMDVADELEDDR